MSAPTGFTLITASKIQDAAGHVLASGRATFFPVSSLSGGPISATAGGGGGMITQNGVPFLVVNGAITTDLLGGTPVIADATLTTPANIAYRVSVTDSTGTEVEGPGYGLVQPSGPSFSLDTYVPIQPMQVTTQYGPPGPPMTFSGTWSSATTYQAGQAVALGGVTYISLVNTNLDNPPASSPGDWAVLLSMGAASGDLSGSFPDPTVVKVNGAAVPASAALVGTNGSGQFIAATAIPSSAIPAATASAVGGVLLASGETSDTLSKVATTGSYGDLSGTPASIGNATSSSAGIVVLAAGQTSNLLSKIATTGRFSDLGGTIAITSGSIDGTPIGATTPAPVTATSVSAATVSASTVSGVTITGTNISGGTLSGATVNASGGALNGVSIGGATPGPIAATTLTAATVTASTVTGTAVAATSIAVNSGTTGIGIVASSSATANTGIQIVNTTTGGKAWDLLALGSAAGVNSGDFCIFDGTDGILGCHVNALGFMQPSDLTFGWASNPHTAAGGAIGTQDTQVSRSAAGAVSFDTGTRGNGLGTVIAANHRSTYAGSLSLAGSTLAAVGNFDTASVAVAGATVGCIVMCAYADGSQIEAGVKIEARCAVAGTVIVTRTALVAGTVTATKTVNVRVIL
jgi:hypothetical protein